MPQMAITSWGAPQNRDSPSALEEEFPAHCLAFWALPFHSLLPMDFRHCLPHFPSRRLSFLFDSLCHRFSVGNAFPARTTAADYLRSIRCRGLRASPIMSWDGWGVDALRPRRDISQIHAFLKPLVWCLKSPQVLLLSGAAHWAGLERSAAAGPPPPPHGSFALVSSLL